MQVNFDDDQHPAEINEELENEVQLLKEENQMQV